MIDWWFITTRTPLPHGISALISTDTPPIRLIIPIIRRLMRLCHLCSIPSRDDGSKVVGWVVKRSKSRAQACDLFSLDLPPCDTFVTCNNTTSQLDTENERGPPCQQPSKRSHLSVQSLRSYCQPAGRSSGKIPITGPNNMGSGRSFSVVRL